MPWCAVFDDTISKRDANMQQRGTSMKIGVIGAGPSGLTTIKQLRDEEHDVVCFEKNADIGGIWYRHENDGDEMKVFDEMQLTISMKLMSFSDFLYEDRVFVDRRGYFQYLQDYAAKYDLRKSIKLNTGVDAVQKVGNQWRVAVTSNGHQESHLFDALAICSGPFRTPSMKVDHVGKFRGEIIHSSRYRNNERFRGKRVLVVGLAESGADIVRQISDVSAECTLLVRQHSFLLPRLFSGRFSTDSYTVRAHHYEMWVRATETPFNMQCIFEDETMQRADFIEATRRYGMKEVMSQVANSFDLQHLAVSLATVDPVAAVSGAVSKAIFAQPPFENNEINPRNNLGQALYPLKVDMFAEATKETIDYINEWNRKAHKGQGSYAPRVILCKNVTFVPNILNGKIQVNETGIRDIKGHTVYFNDNTIREYDCVVLCTGFEHDFSLLRGVDIPNNDVRNLYKHAFHPDHDGTLALIGYVRPYSGGIPICAEMQARYFAQLCSQKLALPKNVRERIHDDKVWEERWTNLSPRAKEAIPSQIFFMDSMAKEIGCLPTCKALADDPELMMKLWFYTFNQSCYRLMGPHSSPEKARESIMKEGLPGGKPASMFFFMASSLLPHFAHPPNQDLIMTPDGGAAPF